MKSTQWISFLVLGLAASVMGCSSGGGSDGGETDSQGGSAGTSENGGADTGDSGASGKGTGGTVAEDGGAPDEGRGGTGTGKGGATSRGGSSHVGEGGSPDVGEGGSPDVGEGGSPDVGEGGSTDVGEGGSPDVGEGGSPDVGEGGSPDVGEGGSPDVGEGGSPDVGEGGSPDVGQGGSPDVGQGGSPDVGQGGSPTGEGGSAGAGGNVVENVPTFIDHTDADPGAIPEDAIAQAKESLHIAYQHTSHGSQLITGMYSLASFPTYGTRYAWGGGGEEDTLNLYDGGIGGSVDDLSQGDSEDENGDTPWVVSTRALLDDPANAHINVILWSWCSINGHNAQRYVDNMEKLIAEYPDVTFVFMTGHAEGGGEDLTENGVYYNNQLIREHCRENGRWLFDFSDIESYDPAGNYYFNRGMIDNLDYDGGNWAVEWIAANPEHDLSLLTMGTMDVNGTNGCAHSDSPREANLNCVLKGAAVWNLFARIAGWSGPKD